MLPFEYRRERLFCEEVALDALADQFGTPLYVYSQSFLEEQYLLFKRGFDGIGHLVCYAVKANSNQAILRLFHRLGAGFDIVSGGELRRALRAGGNPRKMVFSGVGKSLDEIDLALSSGILQFNIESATEMDRLRSRAQALGRMAAFSIRVNPDVDPKTHPYIATGLKEHKFGVSKENALRLYRKARRSPHLHPCGIGFHIGSQITKMEPFLTALDRILDMARALRPQGIDIRHLDLGGGLGIRYRDETPPGPGAYGRAVSRVLRGTGFTVLLEPGRVLVGNAGALITRVILTKANDGKRFTVVDAGMNDLIRPALYGAYHEIRPVILRRTTRRRRADVVGPVCETADFFARDRKMPPARGGDLLAIMSSGAYGFVAASNYNTRPRPAEVLVKGDRFKVVRRRETFADLVRGESPAPL